MSWSGGGGGGCGPPASSRPLGRSARRERRFVDLLIPRLLLSFSQGAGAHPGCLGAKAQFIAETHRETNHRPHSHLRTINSCQYAQRARVLDRGRKPESLANRVQCSVSLSSFISDMKDYRSFFNRNHSRIDRKAHFFFFLP